MLAALAPLSVAFSPATELHVPSRAVPTTHEYKPRPGHFGHFPSSLFAPSADAPSHPRASSAEELKAALQKVAEKHALFWNTSVSIAVHNDSLDLAVAAGINDFSTQTTLTTEERIPMGSTTKMYTAVSVMRLAEQGRLSLDQPVAPLVDKYLATKGDCASMSSFCSKTCLPVAHCIFAPTGAGCSSVSPDTGVECLGYCTQYLHCDASLPPYTLQVLWGNQSEIARVTFRQLLGMTSGVGDYYTDRTNWLYRTVMGGTRDVEPLEYLAHMNHTFFFAPGTPGRGSYSTNGFSLVGLALAGLLGLDDWAKLDQRSLAWGDQLFDDDATLFGTRGTCLSYPRVARQHDSEYTNPHYAFEEISNHSCLNSWLGGNIAARPLDVARFTHAVFGKQSLLNVSSLVEMAQWHEISDNFGAGFLGYGLGLEALWNGGHPSPMISCGLPNYGHAGLDYGSGGIANAYFPDLKLGVSIAIASCMLTGSTVSGMNCSLNYASQPKIGEYLVNDVLALLSTAAGLEPKCSVPSYDPPDPADCKDAPYFGKIGGSPFPTSCSTMLASASRTSHQPEGTLCDQWLGTQTLSMLEASFAKGGTSYKPPPGYDPNTTLAIDLCKATCGALGAGPCWLEGKMTAWCS